MYHKHFREIGEKLSKHQREARDSESTGPKHPKRHRICQAAKGAARRVEVVLVVLKCIAQEGR